MEVVVDVMFWLRRRNGRELCQASLDDDDEVDAAVD